MNAKGGGASSMPSFPNLSAQFKGSLSRYAIVSLVLILFGQLSSFWIIIRVLRRNLSERPILVSWWYLPLGLTKVTLDGPDARCAWSFPLHLSLPLALALLSNLVQESRAACT